MGVLVLLFQTPDIFRLHPPCIIRAIAGVSLIIGSIGIMQMKKWALYILGFSVLFPFIAFLIIDSTALVSLTGFIDLVIFIYLLIICRACGCENEPWKKEKLLRISRQYLVYVAIIFFIFLTIVFFSVLSCALGNSKAGGITKAFGLEEVIEKVQEGINK